MTHQLSSLQALGLRDNPFAEYVAENEPDLDKYLVAPPYVSDCLDRACKSRSFLLFGARGAGKSATRIAVARRAWSSPVKDYKPLVVTMDDFGPVMVQGLDRVTAELFVRQAGFLVVESVLVWLSSLEDSEREIYVDGRDANEQALCREVIDSFYFCCPDHVRQWSAKSAAQLLQYSFASRVSAWAHKRWSAVVEAVTSIGVALTQKKTGIDVSSARPALAELAGARDSRETARPYAGYERAALERLVEFARVFGFTGVSVLIDKADETQQTSDSAEATANLLFPLISNIQLLEVDGFAWGMFLWDRVRRYYADGPQKVRLDKIPCVEIQWDNGQLSNMMDRRIGYFSDGRVPGLEALLHVHGTGDSVQSKRPASEEILDVAMRSPRAAIRVMDSILKEHAELYVGDEAPSFLPPESVERGLDRYCTTTIRDGYDDGALQQLLKVGRTVFTNKDIQETFKIGVASARAKIQRWVDAGLVDRTGTRPAEGDAGGKPAHEYSIVENRLRRIVDRALSLGTQFDLGLEASSTSE